MRSRSFYFLVAILCSLGIATLAQDKSIEEPTDKATDRPASVIGKWQLSWEARLGTAHGTLQLEQADSKITGSFQGPGSLGSPKVSGNVDGNKVSLNLEFQRTRPFTLAFKGVIDGDKMSGKFDVLGVEGGYDSHGESARPSNYTWNAVRATSDATKAESNSPNQSGTTKADTSAQAQSNMKN